MYSRVLKCMAYQEGGLWVAVCLDLCLGAQDSSLHNAKAKLAAQIREYIIDAVQDERYGHQLLKRKAPVSLWIRYYICSFLLKLKGSHALKSKQKVGRVGHGRHGSVVFEQDTRDCCPA